MDCITIGMCVGGVKIQIRNRNTCSQITLDINHSVYWPLLMGGEITDKM